MVPWADPRNTRTPDSKIMKSFTLLVAPLVAAGVLTMPATAQDKQDELQAKYEAKVAKEFVSFGNWQTDYDAVRAQAKKEGKIIFAYFSRSYSP